MSLKMTLSDIAMGVPVVASLKTHVHGVTVAGCKESLDNITKKKVEVHLIC